jgi:HD superfamily phosphohydrolase
MHTAGLLYDSIVQNSKDILASDLGYDDAGFKRNRQLVRLAALVHDVGHSPFSHASEDLFPDQDDGPNTSMSSIQRQLCGARFGTSLRITN